MRKPRKGSNYIMVSDGELRSLWTAKQPAMAPIARRAAIYARMTLEDLIPEKWESPRQPPTRSSFLLVGTSEGEEFWNGISKEQALALLRWVSQEFRNDARAAQ